MQAIMNKIYGFVHDDIKARLLRKTEGLEMEIISFACGVSMILSKNSIFCDIQKVVSSSLHQDINFILILYQFYFRKLLDVTCI